MNIATKSKWLDEKDLLGAEKKICKILSTRNKVIGAHFDLPLVAFFGKPYFGP